MTRTLICKVVFYDQNSKSEKEVYGVVKLLLIYCKECDYITVENLTDVIIAKVNIRDIIVLKKDHIFSMDKYRALALDDVAEMEIN